MAELKEYGLTGVGSHVSLGKGGPNLNNNGGVVEAKDSTNTNLAVLRSAAPVGPNDVVTKQWIETYSTPVVIGNIYDSGSTTPASTQFTSSAQEGYLAICNQTVGTFTTKKLYRLVTWTTNVASSTWTEISPTADLKISTSVASSGGTISFSADHIYMWDVETSTWIDVGPTTAVASVGKNLRQTLAFNTSSPLAIGSVPANAIVSQIIVKVTIAFDGTAPLLDIGVTGTPGKYMGNAEIDLATLGTYVSNLYELEGSGAAIIGTYVAGSSANGAASILINYETI